MKCLQSLVRGLHWALLLLALAVSALFATWHALAAVDFGYPVWYEVLDIDRTIETSGPRNSTRPDFQGTDRAERERLFGAIVDAVHDDGRGLDALTYHDPSGQPIGPLLTRPEIVHLEDVAHLVATFTRAGWVATGVLLVLAIAAVPRRAPPPSGRRIAAVTALLLGVVTAGVLLAGPVRVFYGLHEILFPPEHEWFFYYDESLMSMLMQAPNLFGPIAVAWIIASLVVGALFWLLLARLLRRRA